MSVLEYTSNFGFTLIDYDSQVWHTDEYSNWRKLDSLLTGIASNTPFAVDTGAANAYVVTYSPVIASYSAGLVISFSATHVNTGASTINVNGLGAKNLQLQGAAVAAGIIAVNGYTKLIYTGTHFEVIEPHIVDTTQPDGSITPAKLTTGKPVWDASGNLTGIGTLAASGVLTGAGFKNIDNSLVFSHNDTAYTSAKITYSVSDPSGGANGDLWFKYT